MGCIVLIKGVLVVGPVRLQAARAEADPVEGGLRGAPHVHARHGRLLARGRARVHRPGGIPDPALPAGTPLGEREHRHTQSHTLGLQKA